MVWYYAEGNQQRGPLSDAEFEEMVAQGRIRRETLVWRNGMENWQSLSTVRPGMDPAPPSDAHPPAPSESFTSSTPSTSASPSSTSPTPTGGYQVAGSEQSPAAGNVPCNNCGRQVPGSDVTRFGSINICSTCRPGFVAQVQQAEALRGAPAAGTVYVAAAPAVKYGGFWFRAIARIADHLLISILGALFLAPFLTPMQAALEGVTSFEDFLRNQEQFEQARNQVFPYILMLHVVYHSLFVGIFSATPGKLMLGLRVIGKEGVRVSFGRAIVRAVVPALLLIIESMTNLGIGLLILMIGYLIIAFDSEKRSLYDRIAGTRVIKKR